MENQNHHSLFIRTGLGGNQASFGLWRLQRPPKIYHIVASACDKDLLSSGEYSDVTVECEGKKWCLHRAIIMQRCPFFRSATSDNGIIKLHNQDPKQVELAIYFIYHGEMPIDVRRSLENRATAMGTCIDLFTLANLFGLYGLRKRAEQVLDEYLLFEAERIQSMLKFAAELEDFRPEFEEFVIGYLETARIVYSTDRQLELQSLKPILMNYVKNTGWVVLREELLGERIFTDPTLAGFRDDILKKTLFGPFRDKRESMKRECAQCECRLGDAAIFGDDITKNGWKAWCRKCKPVGEPRVMELLGHATSSPWCSGHTSQNEPK
ncbi:hypothetical protein O1611_g6881 [Lasiodiplodia mahajangana]|uniref:Uncharacterized protein n=1 Tax=Lasiodiplodia mahajangana TaxID=1108764 RepID=A0ACC2JGW6_9PEZI|nr:hypothetical protein O1611_g6881 [Lasiodiplodia mahajangana]